MRFESLEWIGSRVVSLFFKENSLRTFDSKPFGRMH
ncbi:hypothetical protein OIU79_025670 [Salix purpurea]|uniref:Uncharacterized protein n=1 Tax=Salix purpurea TaxID=77065 RepID=A0A9Q1A7M2_SALPP|nr:hypothetical protein OIU79_025670 [Salix purpurea]